MTEYTVNLTDRIKTGEFLKKYGPFLFPGEFALLQIVETVWDKFRPPSHEEQMAAAREIIEAARLSGAKTVKLIVSKKVSLEVQTIIKGIKVKPRVETVSTIEIEITFI